MDGTGHEVGGPKVKDRLVYEREAREDLFTAIAGIDEVGRAAWAGPMIAAAVILPEGFDTTGLRDSKKVKPASRQRHYERLMSSGIPIAIATVSPREIDDRGIDVCNMEILLAAIRALPTKPDFVLVDGNFEIPNLGIKQRVIPEGDDLSASIGAASIIAKVECDRIMEKADVTYPGYDFARNKGDGGAKGSNHRLELERHGPSPIHRESVRPVRDWLNAHGERQ